MGKEAGVEQVSMFGNFKVAETLIRAAKEIGNMPVTVKDYGEGRYGVKVKNILFSDKLNKKAAELIAGDVELLIKKTCGTLAMMAKSVVDDMVENVVDSAV